MNNTQKNIEGFGDRQSRKKDRKLVCLSLNANRLRCKDQKIKDNSLCNLLLNYKADLISLQEINLNQSYVSPKENWNDRIISW